MLKKKKKTLNSRGQSKAVEGFQFILGRWKTNVGEAIGVAGWREPQQEEPTERVTEKKSIGFLACRL